MTFTHNSWRNFNELHLKKARMLKHKKTNKKIWQRTSRIHFWKKTVIRTPPTQQWGENWIGMYMSMGGLAISYIRWQFKQLGKTNLEAYSAICWFVLVCVTFSKWNLYYVWTQIKCAFGNELLNKIFVSIKRQCLMVNTHYSNKCSQT